MAGRKPDYRLKAMQPFVTRERWIDSKGSVGAGWLNENGSISIRLDPFITLRSEPGLILTLFPEKSKVKE